MNIQQVLQEGFGYSEKYSVSLIRKCDAQTLKRAIKDTQTWKPGDRKYLKEKYKILSSPRKVQPWQPPSSYQMDGDRYRKIKKENNIKLQEIQKRKIYHNCDICGNELEFHSRLKHEWLNTKKLIEQRHGQEINP